MFIFSLKAITVVNVKNDVSLARGKVCTAMGAAG